MSTFQLGEFYKHELGVDAVIRINSVNEYEHGYELMVTWHILNYDRVPGPAQQPSQHIFVSKEHANDWILYEL